MVENKERLLSTNEVARLLHIHPNTVRNMLRDGRLQAIKTRGETGQFRFRESDIEAYLEGEGAPNLFERKEKDTSLHSLKGALENVRKEPGRSTEDALEFLGDCGNPYRVLGSYLETAVPEQYSRYLEGKAAIWAEETLRQIDLQFKQSSFSITFPGTKEEFMQEIGVGIAAKKSGSGKWLLTSMLVYPREKPQYILDGTLQQFHPKMEKGVILLPWKDREIYYTSLEVITPSEFIGAVNDRNGTYFQAFLQKINRDYSPLR